MVFLIYLWVVLISWVEIRNNICRTRKKITKKKKLNWKRLGVENTLDQHTNSDIKVDLPFTHGDINAITDEISELLKTGVIKLTSDEKEQYVSPLFAILKKDCVYQLILNLMIT